MESEFHLERDIPRWSLPLEEKFYEYIGLKGGRSSGKSHWSAEDTIEQHVCDPNYSTVCIREVQQSLRFSAKRLLESKIRSMGVSSMFEVQDNVIKRRGGNGVIIFQGMQNHTAESIKSLEDFDRALLEEAQNLSMRSLELLIPTIRKDGSQIIAVWNPENDTDPVDSFFNSDRADSICLHVNYLDNPFCPEKAKREAEYWLKRDPESYAHVWLGAYNTKSDDQVLSGVWTVDQIEIDDSWNGPYYGGDWGFSVDPATVVEVWIKGNILYVRREIYEHGVEIDDTPEFYDRLPGAKDHVVRADSARPEIISYMNRHGYPRVKSVKKWDGSVADGISKLRSFDIVIDPSCIHAIDEARLWKYKRDRLTGDVLPKLIDANNHIWDGVRYAIEPLIKNSREVRVMIVGGKQV